jgi:hypothetical protein
MGRVERSRELARRRKRREKLRKIRRQHAAAKSEADKQVLVQKARKVSPFINIEAPAAAE